MEEKTGKQRAAQQLITDYMLYLSDHERMIERIVDEKWQAMLPAIEQAIDRKIKEHNNK